MLLWQAIALGPHVDLLNIRPDMLLFVGLAIIIQFMWASATAKRMSCNNQRTTG